MVCYVCVQSELLGSFLRRLILHGGGVLIGTLKDMTGVKNKKYNGLSEI